MRNFEKKTFLLPLPHKSFVHTRKKFKENTYVYSDFGKWARLKIFQHLLTCSRHYFPVNKSKMLKVFTSTCLTGFYLLDMCIK